jgi:hypothetical protein
MSTTELTSKPDGEDLAKDIASLLGQDYSKLSARIRTLEHDIKCASSQVTLRLHFPAFRGATPSIGDLVDVIALYILHFALPRSQVAELQELFRTVSFEEYSLRQSQLEQEAFELFKRAQEATNRNGEAGELILYLLTEWILQAPQLLAKMCLKTNRDMPVHGADGIHVRYCQDRDMLHLYWGESKVHADVNKAISEAAASIVQALKHESVKHELGLVSRHINLTGIGPNARREILRYLDPFDEKSNQRVSVTTCLIGFDFQAFERTLAPNEAPESVFCQSAKAKLAALAPRISAALSGQDLSAHQIELFLFPLPSVKELRSLFQKKIGWKHASP